mgnify:FL=1|tara:strand:- start:203 stop:574 length:372 start_codon:yes stop_codon:yes gene_type:complete
MAKQLQDRDSDNLQVDYEYTRDNLRELIEKGKDSLDLAMRIAEETEHPRAIEVLGQMLRSVTDTNDKLMDLNKKKADAEEGTKRVTNNNLFVGSTTELQRILSKDKKEEKKMVNITPQEKDSG